MFPRRQGVPQRAFERRMRRLGSIKEILLELVENEHERTVRRLFHAPELLREPALRRLRLRRPVFPHFEMHVAERVVERVWQPDVEHGTLADAARA